MKFTLTKFVIGLLLIGCAPAARSFAQEITKREVTTGSLQAGDPVRKVARVGGFLVDSYYDCHVIHVAAGEGVQVYASATSDDGASTWARIGNAACTSLQDGLGSIFIAREATAIGIAVTTESAAAAPLAYQLVVERFDGAAVEREADDLERADRAFRNGITALQAANFQAALAAFQEAQILAPGNPAANLYLGVAFKASGDLVNAEKSYWRVLQAPLVETENAVWQAAMFELNAIAASQINAENLEAAESVLDRLYSLNSWDTGTLQNLVRLHGSRGEWVEAMKHTATLAQFFPLSREVWSTLKFTADEVVKGAPGNGKDPGKIGASSVTLARTIEEMPFFIDGPSPSYEEGYLRVRGRIIGNSAAQGSVFRISFDTGDSDDHYTRELIVAVPARGEVLEFDRKFHAGRPRHVSYRYKACPTCKPELGTTE